MVFILMTCRRGLLEQLSLRYLYDKRGNFLNSNGKMYTFNGVNEITVILQVI